MTRVQKSGLIGAAVAMMLTAGAIAYTPSEAAAFDDCCADNLKKQFHDGGYLCWNIVCNPLRELCCGTYQPE